MTNKSKNVLSLSAGITGGLGIGLGFITGVDPQTIVTFLSDTAGNKIAQAGFFFVMASWIHSGRVKKEIKLNFADLTKAINNVASSFREDLAKQGERLDNLADRVTSLEGSHIK